MKYVFGADIGGTTVKLGFFDEKIHCGLSVQIYGHLFLYTILCQKIKNLSSI